MLRTARRALGPLGYDALARTRGYQMLRDAPWAFDPRAMASRARLHAFHDGHAGERCFIIGTGPSLRRTELSRIGADASLGLNRLYYGFEELDLVPTYHVVVNALMLEQSGTQIADLPIPIFAAWIGRRWLPFRSNVTFLRTFAGEDFAQDPTDRVFVGATVTYVALQLAYWMGFAEVVLLGVDHRFTLTGNERAAGPNAAVRREVEDLNHFRSDYVAKGQAWQTPDLEASRRAYVRARDAFAADGRAVYDATVGGALDVFPRYRESFEKAEAG